MYKDVHKKNKYQKKYGRRWESLEVNIYAEPSKAGNENLEK